MWWLLALQGAAALYGAHAQDQSAQQQAGLYEEEADNFRASGDQYWEIAQQEAADYWESMTERAEAIQEAGEYQAEAIQREGARLAGEIVAQVGSSGAQMRGTPITIIMNQEHEAEIGAAIANWNADQEAGALLTEAERTRDSMLRSAAFQRDHYYREAAMRDRAADNISSSRGTNFLANILAGGAGVASSYGTGYGRLWGGGSGGAPSTAGRTPGGGGPFYNPSYDTGGYYS